MVQFTNAWPDGYVGGGAAACPSGLARVANGGGCAPASLPSSVFVGPFAKVLAGADVSGNVRVEDHATIVSGTVSGGTVGALTLLGSQIPPLNTNMFSLSGSAIAQTTFYPLGFFESGQSISGTARLSATWSSAASVSPSRAAPSPASCPRP
jgi:hypothetical protein